MNPWSRSRAAFRALLAAGALVYAALLLRGACVEWIVEHPAPRRLLAGLRWDSGNPELWRAYARSIWQPVDNARSPEVIRAYRQALSGNPFDVNTWDDLATEHFRLGESRPAEAALRAGLAAVPQSPKASWRLANFLLQQGRQEESYPFFRAAAASDGSLLDPLFELGWKLLGDSQGVYDRLVPQMEEGRARYFDFLLRRRLLREAFPIWQQILPTAPRRFVHPGENFATELALAGIGDLSESVWNDATRAAGLASCRPPDEAICNGDFEAPMRNAGLDWQIERGSGFSVSLDSFEAHSGGRALRVDFDGTSDPEFGAIHQLIPVEPNAGYRFQAYLKTSNLSTSKGVFLLLATRGAPEPESWQRTTAEAIGDTPWSFQELDLHTGPHTNVLVVYLWRHQSAGNSALQGTVWLDGVSLRLQSPANPVAFSAAGNGASRE